MAKTKVDEVINTDISKLLKSVTNDIKKDFEEGLATNTEVASLSFLSTGNPGINYAISGHFDGGFPEGLITELYGENSTGKTLLALHALVETQKRGGVAVLIDAEFAFNPQWYKTLGGDSEQLIHYEPDYIEQIYQFTEKVTQSVRKKDKEIPVTIVLDSVAASPSKHEYDGAEYDMGKRAQAHGKGIRMLMGLCKKNNITFIAINQLRHTFSLFGLDKDTIGGMAWKYATSLRVRMKKGKKIEQKMDVGKKVVGIHGSIVVEKSRLRSPFSKASFDIYFDYGIDPKAGLFNCLKEEGIIKPAINDEGKISKGWWVYEDIKFHGDGEMYKVLDKYPELLGGCVPIDLPDSEFEIEKGGDDDDEREVVEQDDIESVEADM